MYKIHNYPQEQSPLVHKKNILLSSRIKIELIKPPLLISKRGLIRWTKHIDI